MRKNRERRSSAAGGSSHAAHARSIGANPQSDPPTGLASRLGCHSPTMASARATTWSERYIPVSRNFSIVSRADVT